MRKQIGFGLALLLCLSLTVPAFAKVPDKPAESSYVYDYANVLSEATERNLRQNGLRLAHSGPSLVLVTVSTMDGAYADDYALELFNTWGIGDEATGDGVLILMVPDDNKYWALQGKGLEQSFSSGLIANLLDEYMQADFDAGNYDQAAQATYRAFLERLGGSWADLATDTADNVTSLYVKDTGNVLSGTDAAYIAELAEDVNRQVGAAVAVVTVPTSNGNSLRDEAISLFKQYGYAGNTVLLVIYTLEDDYYVLPGSGVEKVVTSAVINEVIADKIEPLFATGDYSGAARQAAESFSVLILQEGRTRLQGQSSGGFSSVVGSVLSALLVLFFIFLLVFFIAITPRRRFYRSYYGVPYYPYAPRYMRRYGPGGYWGRWGAPRPGFHSSPLPPGFDRRSYRGPGPMGPGEHGYGSRPGSGFGAGGGRPGGSSGGFGGGARPGSSSGNAFGSPKSGSYGRSGGSRPSGAQRSNPFGGGSSRGGGSGTRSGGSFGGGRSGGSFGGGGSRGGGAGRR